LTTGWHVAINCHAGQILREGVRIDAVLLTIENVPIMMDIGL